MTKELARLDNSANRDGLFEEKDRLEELQSAICAVLSFNTLLHAPSPDAEELTKSGDQVRSRFPECGLGPGVWLASLRAWCAHHCLYQEYESFCSLFQADSAEAA